MKKNLIMLVVALQTFFCSAEWKYIPFDYAMKFYQPGFKTRLETTTRIIGIDGDVVYLFFKNLYEKNQPEMLEKKLVPTIPKIIHQIWIGSEVPETLRPFMQTWTAHHLGPEWRYVLWTDKEVAMLPLYNQKFYDESDNYGVKSDILKYELIFRYGGVYIDTDFECLQPLDIFHEYYDFYTALQPLDTQFVQLGAALFAARPGHPILKHCIETVASDWHLKGAPTKTGPVHFTKSFYAMADQNGSIDIAFPAFYFYPLGCLDAREHWARAGAFGVHWWSKLWMPKAYRPAEFKTIDNQNSTYNWNT